PMPRDRRWTAEAYRKSHQTDIPAAIIAIVTTATAAHSNRPRGRSFSMSAPVGAESGQAFPLGARSFFYGNSGAMRILAIGVPGSSDRLSSPSFEREDITSRQYRGAGISEVTAGPLKRCKSLPARDERLKRAALSDLRVVWQAGSRDGRASAHQRVGARHTRRRKRRSRRTTRSH